MLQTSPSRLMSVLPLFKLRGKTTHGCDVNDEVIFRSFDMLKI